MQFLQVWWSIPLYSLFSFNGMWQLFLPLYIFFVNLHL